jgi:spore maturation protein CgeB
MSVVVFCHSILSDWNHGNAHFLRGLCREFARRGEAVRVFEPADAWSVQNLIADAGPEALEAGRLHEPLVRVDRYEPGGLDLRAAIADAQLVLVHEWTDPELVAELGKLRAETRAFCLLFHDTHHRSVTEPAAMARLDLRQYDGVLAFGEAVRESYLKSGWARRVWTFHEAADAGWFSPRPELTPSDDLVWIGNFGDDERTRELEEFLFGPVRALGISGSIYGVRYPEAALRIVHEAGLAYRGWLSNLRVPDVFARHRLTVHVPRRPYVEALPGIPTIRVFEALACGIPLISAPWTDSEGLFRDGDFVRARDGGEMREALAWLLRDPDAARGFAARGRETILARHTCAHRVDQLKQIVREVESDDGAIGASRRLAS